MSADSNTFNVRRKVIFLQNLKYFCPAFPYRRGYLTVKVGGGEYKMVAISPEKTFELVYPKSGEDGWTTTCIQHYIGPDLIMITENCYTNYIKLI